MTNKILIILSAVIIILALLNLRANQKAALPNIVEVKPKISIYELNKDIEKNKPIFKQDLEIKQVEFDEKYIKEGYLLSEDNLKLKKAKTELKKGQTLKLANLKEASIIEDEDKKTINQTLKNTSTDVWVDLKPSKNTLNVSKGYVAYAFDVNIKELETLKNIDKNELVDIYYLYSTPADRNKGIVAKSDERNNILIKETGNNTNLKILFKDKKLLALKKNIKESKNANYAATAFFELDTNEAKIAYTIASLGKFLFFPANDNDDNSYSIKKILPSKFIKEIRGDR